MTSEEVERSLQEIWALFKETGQRFKETDRKFQETDQRSKETDRKFQETDRKLEEKFSAMSESVAALSGKWGKFVEGLIAPAVEKLFAEKGIMVDKISQRVRAPKNGSRMEIDILAIDHEYAVLIEAKSTLTVKDVQDHVQRLAQFKTFFPEYQEKKTVGAVAGIVIEEDADADAYRQGLFVIAQSGETVKILNDAKFKPKTW